MSREESKDEKTATETKQPNFAERIQLAVEGYNQLKSMPEGGFETCDQDTKVKIYKSLVFCREEFLSFLDENSEESVELEVLQNGEMGMKLITSKSEAEFNRYSIMDQNAIMQAFPDRELTPKTPEIPSFESGFFDFSDNIEWINNIETFIAEMRQNPSFESGYKAFRTQFQLFEYLCPPDVLDKEPIVTDLESAFLAVDFASFCISCVKDENDTLVYEYSAIKTILDNSKNRKRNNQSINENLLEIIKVYISEKEEVARKSERPYKLLKQFIDDTFGDLSQKQKEELILEIGEDSSFQYDKLINDIESAYNRNSNTAKKSIKRQIEKVLDSIQAREKVEPENSTNSYNESASNTSSNQNEGTGNSGGNNNLPPNRPKTAESNEDKSFDGQFRSLLEFINQNFGEQKDEIVSKLLTYCFAAEGMEFLGLDSALEVVATFGIIGAKEQVDAALELLGDVAETQDKKEIIDELITSLEANLNSLRPIENTEPDTTPDPWITPIEDYGNEEVEQIAIEAQQVATELESLIEVSVRIPTVVVIFWYIAKYGEQIQELKNLIKNNPEKVKDVYDDIQRRFEQESRRLRQRVAIRFYSPQNQEYSDAALTEMGITLTNAEVDFYADGRPETNKSSIRKNNEKDPNYRSPVNVDENGNLTKVNNYVRSVVDNLISNNIQAERISFEDDYFAFVTDGMFILVKEDTAVEIVWDPELDNLQMKVMLEEHRKEKNSYNLPQFCFLRNLKYTKIIHRNTKDEDNNLITSWITRQQQAITNPQDYVGWNVDRSREYDPKDVQQLVGLGFDVEQISTLYSSINTYESFDRFEIYGLPTKLVDLDNDAFSDYINSMFELSEKSFKKNQIASSTGKQETPEKIALVLESNFEAIKSNPIFIDYITGFKSFLDKARILKLQLSSLPKVKLDKGKINRISLFLGNVLSENKYKIDKSNSANSLMRVFLRARLDLLKQGHILNQKLN